MRAKLIQTGKDNTDMFNEWIFIKVAGGIKQKKEFIVFFSKKIDFL